MENITDQLVTFEIAELLKEKGFDLRCNNAFLNLESLDVSNGGTNNYIHPQNHNEKEHRYSRPTQSLAQRWLREVHKLIILIELRGGHDTFGYFIKNNYEQHRWVRTNDIYPTYELALESALQEGLKLIEL